MGLFNGSHDLERRCAHYGSSWCPETRAVAQFMTIMWLSDSWTISEAVLKHIISRASGGYIAGRLCLSKD